MPGERSEVFRGKARIENHAGRTEDGARVQGGADAAFAVVPHQDATELQSRVFHPSGGKRPLPHGAVGVFEIA